MVAEAGQALGRIRRLKAVRHDGVGLYSNLALNLGAYRFNYIEAVARLATEGDCLLVRPDLSPPPGGSEK